MTHTEENNDYKLEDKIELCDKGKSYQFTMAIPELKKDDLNLSIEDNVIVLKSQTTDNNDNRNALYKKIEIPKNADISKIKAQMGNGILSVCIAKSKE